MTFSNNLKYLRLKNKLSQENIADKLGYKSFTTIQKWESGISEPSVEKLKILAELFNVSMDQLLSVDLSATEYNNMFRFQSVQDALKFIIAQPMVAAFGGYDLDTMSDEEIIDFANDVADMIEIAARKYKKK